MPYRVLTLFACFMLLLSASAYAEDNNQLVVTWLENSEVMVWHTGDTAPTHHTVPENLAGNIRQLLISADGQYVALNTTYPGSLWLATSTNADLIEAVPNEALPVKDDPKYTRIGNLQRGANATFYFNTYSQPSHYSFQNNDLWSIDAATRTLELLLPPSEGGFFNLSPDNQHIAIIQSGSYGESDGKISLVDSSGQGRQDILTFTAVSTASDYDFYPQVFWEANSTGFNIAIPEKDLIYNDDTALAALWHIAIDGTNIQRGSVQATFFGLPQWSDDGANLVYLHRVGDITTNQFELMIATGDGTNPSIYASGEAGNIGMPHWLPNSDQFIYSQGEPGDYWIGQAGQSPQQFPEKLFSPYFVDSRTYVYTTNVGNMFELRYAQLGGTTSTLIASVHDAVPLFDAILVP